MQLIYNVLTFATLAFALPSTGISKLNESDESTSAAPKQCRAGQRYCFSEVLNELSMHLKTPFHIFSSMSCFQSLVLTANSWSSASDIAQKKTSRSSSTNTATKSIKTTGIAAIPARDHGLWSIVETVREYTQAYSSARGRRCTSGWVGVTLRVRRARGVPVARQRLMELLNQ